MTIRMGSASDLKTGINIFLDHLVGNLPVRVVALFLADREKGQQILQGLRGLPAPPGTALSLESDPLNWCLRGVWAGRRASSPPPWL